MELGNKKPISLDEEDDTGIAVTFVMPKNTYKKLGQLALDRETSRSALVREALIEYIARLEKPEEQNPKVPDRTFNQILRECRKEDGGFEIDGENGFVAKMKAKNFKLKSLTPLQWERAKPKIEKGWEGYLFKPELDEWLQRWKPLEPSPQQLAELSGKEEETEEESEETP